MRSRIATSIARAIRTKPTHENVHFHVDSNGRPYVCDIDRCESPVVSASEVGLGRN